jgi:TPR repeat protein
MGKIEMAAPDPLACIERRLERFVEQQSDNSQANYLYAMAILKHHEQSPSAQSTQQAETLLKKAVLMDGKCSAAYLQLGILSATRRDFQMAIGFYAKAIETNPQMSEAHYRLGVAYDRIGEHDKAMQEFQLHDEFKKRESEAIDRQRREVKQFLVVLPGQPSDSPMR